MSERIKYCPDCGKEVSPKAVVCPNCGVQLKSLTLGSGKNRFVAAVLAFFLGGFGIQWFYLDKAMYGILSLLFCWTFIPSVISFIHFVILLLTSDEEFNRKYNQS